MNKLITVGAAVAVLAISGAAQALSFDINGQPVTYTPNNGYYGGSNIITNDPSITLIAGASVAMDSAMASTSVQHFGFNLTMSSVPYLTGYYRSFRGLFFGQIILRESRALNARNFIIDLNANAGNSVPTSYMNPEDLIMKFSFNGSKYDVGFAPGSYTFDFAFDNINNNTTLNITGGTTASKTWSGTMSVNSFDFVSEAWSYGEGSTLNVSNFVYGPVPEPAAITVLGLGVLDLLRRKRKA